MKWIELTLLHQTAASKRVPCVSWQTSALRCMFDNRTGGLGTTRAGTRVSTLFRLARPVTGTLRIDGTLWPTVGWPPYVLLLAWTCRISTDHTAHRVRTTRRWHARVAAGWSRRGSFCTCINTHANHTMNMLMSVRWHDFPQPIKCLD